MKKLICSACVMMMVSSTPFEVSGANVQAVIDGVANSAMDTVTQAGEPGVYGDMGNMDDVFGPGARFTAPDGPNGGHLVALVSVDANGGALRADGTPIADWSEVKRVIATGEYDETTCRVFGGKKVWDAAVAFNTANDAYEDGFYGDYAALARNAAEAIGNIKWTAAEWAAAAPEVLGHGTADQRAAFANEQVKIVADAYAHAAKTAEGAAAIVTATARESVTAGHSINSVARLWGKKGGMNHVNPPEEAPLFARVERLAEGKEVVDYPLILPTPPAAPPLPAGAIAAPDGAVPPPPPLQ